MGTRTERGNTPSTGTGRAPRVGRIAGIAFPMVALEVLGPKSAGAAGNIEELHDHEPYRGFRTGSVDATARWNQFGTPRSLIGRSGSLATDVAGFGRGSAPPRAVSLQPSAFDRGRGPRNIRSQ